jgi:hypothetical protein
MKIKILIFANLVLIGFAIALYVERSTESSVTPTMTGKPASPPIPPETTTPWNETASNASPQSVDEAESNAVPKMVPRTNGARHHQPTQGLSRNAKRPAAAREKDFASVCSFF